MMGNKKIATVLILLLACGLLSGCFFEPRVPALPSTGTTVRYLDKIASGNVWDNLEISLEASHAPGWEDNISLENFIYIPDTEAEAQFPGIFTGWDRAREVSFINAFYNSDVSISAQIRNDEFTVPPDAGTQMEWENVIYDVTVTNNADQSVTRYRGSAIITFRLEGNFWYIYQWRDQQGESDPNTGQLLPTMGVLRGTFGSN